MAKIESLRWSSKSILAVRFSMFGGCKENSIDLTNFVDYSAHFIYFYKAYILNAKSDQNKIHKLPTCATDKIHPTDISRLNLNLSF